MVISIALILVVAAVVFLATMAGLGIGLLLWCKRNDRKQMQNRAHQFLVPSASKKANAPLADEIPESETFAT